MRRALRHALDFVLQASGANAAYARMAASSGATILMYHSVAEPSDAAWIDPPNHLPPARFEAHLAFLARHRRVVPLQDVCAALRRGESCPRGTVVLTFDDGYLDNLTVAAPLLQRYELPATLYLPTAYIDRAENHWADVVHGLLHHGRATQVQVAGVTFKLPAQRSALRAALHRQLLPASAEDRRLLLGELGQQLPLAQQPPRLTMNWDDVRRMRAEFPQIDIGAHTVEHLDLQTHTGAEADYELRAARDSLERELGQLVRHMSFPYGRAAASSVEQVTQAGYASGLVTADLPLVQAGTDPAALPRIEAPTRVSELAMWTAGGHPYLRRRLMGQSL